MDTTEDFSPYRADGKLVSCNASRTKIRMMGSILTKRSMALFAL